eukprot:SAG25_NODE_1083_length_4081_cov_3.031140_2_plen_76_part_00
MFNHAKKLPPLFCATRGVNQTSLPLHRACCLQVKKQFLCCCAAVFLFCRKIKLQTFSRRADSHTQLVPVYTGPNR